MSVTITISDETYQRLEKEARSKGFEDVGTFLDQFGELKPANRREMVKSIRAFRQKMQEKYGVMPDSVEILREDRMRG